VDRLSFAEAAKRLEEVDRVARKLDPAIRGQAFIVLGGYVLDQLRGADVIGLLQLVLREVAVEAERDLRELLDEVKRLDEQKARLRDLVDRLAQESTEIAMLLRSDFADVLDPSEGGGLESRLQVIMDQKSRLEQMISNILKASSETESGVIENLK
jgi:hypothetical protein